MDVYRPPVPDPAWLSPDEAATRTIEVPLAGALDAPSGWRLLGRADRMRWAVDRHCAEVARLVGSGGYDVLLSHPCRFVYAPPLARLMPGLPRLLYLQEPNRFLYEALPDLPWLPAVAGSSRARRTRRALELPGLRRLAFAERENAAAFGRILVNSLFSRESVARAYGLDASVCSLGVDTDIFSPDGSPRERFVLGVGGIAPTKRVDVAIEVCGRAGLPLVWAGVFSDAVEERRLRALASEGGMSVDWRVGASQEEVVRLYRTCLALLATARLEPFGYTPVEAAACGTPVVAVAEGGFRETVEHGETGFLAGEAEGLGFGLRLLADDPALARRLGEAGREDALARWTLGAATDRLEAELRAVVVATGENETRP